MLSEHKLELNLATFPDQIVIQRQQSFANGDFLASYFTLRTKLDIKGSKQRKWRDPDNSEWTVIRDAAFSRVPRIAYFPTFVFEFSKTIFLTERGGVVDRFYRRVFQDILDYDGRGQTIEKDIVRRVRREEMVLPWISFLTTWSAYDDRDKIQQVMDRASAAVTRLVFGRWNKIFGEDTRGKEVSITCEVVEGEKEDAKRTKTKANEHGVQIKFQIKDGTRRFDVNDRLWVSDGSFLLCYSPNFA